MVNSNQKKPTSSSTLAISQDGNIQITINIPWEKVKTVREEVLDKLASEVDIPGFRKGNAPKEIARSKISSEKLTQETLVALLSQAYRQALEQHKIQPILNPRFELLKIKENEDWQVRAVTCEYPHVELGDYKKEIFSQTKVKNIWVPSKNKSQSPQEPKTQTQEEKEQEVLKILLQTAKVDVPQILIEEEVNHRLSNLIAQIEKLGLRLEQYLSSIGKTAEELRKDYTSQSQESLKLELILGEIAKKEGIDVEDKEIEQALNQLKPEDRQSVNEQQKLLIKSVLIKRKTLDRLVSFL